ncbi:hypothetical protein OHV05_24365 [Kitasatospora sp. NBC_00070]|uniref:hypothetical protein n=1 Tax=Kitasatospora sp. NBC_00070 TaxID=2975962 RepID=UPI003247712F
MTTDDRYRPEQQLGGISENGRVLPGLWAIRDTQTGALVQTAGELELHATDEGVHAWIRRNRYLTEVDRGRA